MSPSVRLTTFVLNMYKQLTSEQRYTICVLLQNKKTLSFIAETIGVSVSTVSRERKRNANKAGNYDSRHAALMARRRKSRNPGNRSLGPRVRCMALGLVREEQWSPEEVAGWLEREKGVKVSKSTIYNWIGECSPHQRDNIRRHLRHGGRRRKGRSAGPPIPNRVSIDQRPSEGFGRTVGDWEMDTIVGKRGKGVIVTLVDRKSCYLTMAKLDTGKQAEPLARTVVRLLKETGLPVRTITTDNGSEFARHETIARELGTTVFFAHPYSAWEKGAIENMNGLIRQYIPKNTDFRGISHAYVKHVMDKINNRPRKKSNFYKPKDYIIQFFS